VPNDGGKAQNLASSSVTLDDGNESGEANVFGPTPDHTNNNNNLHNPLHRDRSDRNDRGGHTAHDNHHHNGSPK